MNKVFGMLVKDGLRLLAKAKQSKPTLLKDKQGPL